MHHKGKENLSRKLVWVEVPGVAGWGCSECNWVFNPTVPRTTKTLDELVRNLHVQLSEEFASHVCTDYPRLRKAHGR
jgi:hypothetical protein